MAASSKVKVQVESRPAPRRWGLVSSIHGRTEVTREATEEEYDADDLRHNSWLDGARLCAPGETGDVAVAFEPVAGMHAYAVTVAYGTGDSFHREEGLMVVAAVYADEKFARRAKAAIESADKSYSVALFEPDGTISRVSSQWTGYFESVESVEVHAITLEAAPAPKPPRQSKGAK